MGLLDFLIHSMCILLDFVDMILLLALVYSVCIQKPCLSFYMELLKAFVGFGIHVVVALTFPAIRAVIVCWVNELLFLWLKLVYS